MSHAQCMEQGGTGHPHSGCPAGLNSSLKEGAQTSDTPPTDDTSAEACFGGADRPTEHLSTGMGNHAMSDADTGDTDFDDEQAQPEANEEPATGGQREAALAVSEGIAGAIPDSDPGHDERERAISAREQALEQLASELEARESA